MGKTTVLRAVEAELKRSQPIWRDSGLLVIPAYIDGLALPRPLNPLHLWTEILNHIERNTGDVSRPLAAPRDFGEFAQIAQVRLEAIESAVRVIVMIDEIEHILACDWADGFFANWRALLSNMPGLSVCFSAVFSGANELSKLKEDVGSPLMDILEWRSLRNLSYSDACRLVQEPIGVQHSNDFMLAIYAETGGHPMLLQYVMHHICKEGAPDFTPQNVGQVSKQFVEERGWQLAEWWNKYCTSIAQRVYLRLGNSSLTPLRELVVEFGATEANEGCEVLLHVGLIESTIDGMSFRRSGAMFQRWVDAFGQRFDENNQDPIVSTRLGKLDSELASKYISAWGILGVALPNYSGAVSEMRDIITSVLHRTAPDNIVMTEPGFQAEPGQTRPTRRQRAKFAARAALGSSELVKSVVSEIDLFDAHCEQVATTVTTSYAAASSLTHTTATRTLAHLTLRQSDSILLQILPP
jgi:hypothetical protein